MNYRVVSEMNIVTYCLAAAVAAAVTVASERASVAVASFGDPVLPFGAFGNEPAAVLGSFAASVVVVAAAETN